MPLVSVIHTDETDWQWHTYEQPCRLEREMRREKCNAYTVDGKCEQLHGLMNALSAKVAPNTCPAFIPTIGSITASYDRHDNLMILIENGLHAAMFR